MTGSRALIKPLLCIKHCSSSAFHMRHSCHFHLKQPQRTEWVSALPKVTQGLQGHRAHPVLFSSFKFYLFGCQVLVTVHGIFSYVCSVESAFLQPHEQQAGKLLCSWDSPGKHGGLSCSSRGSSRPRDRTQVSCIAGRFFTI